MTTTNGNRKVLDLKRWEFCAPAVTASVAGSSFDLCKHVKQMALYLVSSTVAYLYYVEEDAFTSLPSPALAGTVGAGTAVCNVPWSTGATNAASLTATSGTTTTIVTNQTLARDLRGFSVHILSGPNAGVTIPIVSNTIGANATITVAAQGTAFSSSTTFRLLTPRWFVINPSAAGTTTSSVVKFYDFATNTWNNAGASGFAPAVTIGTDSRLISTPSWKLTGYESLATGTSSAAGTTATLVTTKNWGVNQWANSQVRIVSGTGAGQVRPIASNTATTLTVSPVFATAPDATSVYSIEANDDNIYYIGSAAVTLYKYSISAGTWSTITPGTARAAAPSTGLSGHFIGVSGDSVWSDETAIINGRRIYSLRGGASSVIDVYDLATNAWSVLSYAPAIETFTSGSGFATHDQYIYLQKDATGRWFRLNVVTGDMDPWSTATYPQGAAVIGDKCFAATYVDGTTKINYVYMLVNTSTVLLRQMVI